MLGRERLRTRAVQGHSIRPNLPGYLHWDLHLCYLCILAGLLPTNLCKSSLLFPLAFIGGSSAKTLKERKEF